MALNKVNYIDGQTLITAKNMNEIQDEVIRLTELIEVPSSGVVKTVNGVEPDENGNVEVEVSEDVVLYTAQTLTEQQKTQVCTNIGAQKTLNFDTTPISGSTNPVTSGGLSSKFATQDENIEMASMAASIAMPGSLKWDGYVGDKECVIVEEEGSGGAFSRMQFVHVSDYVPAILPLIMSQISTEERTLTALCSMSGMEAGGMHQVTEISAQVADDMSIMSEAFVYVPTDGYLAEGIMFPKKGWYFMSANVYLSGIEIPLMYVNGLKIEGLNFPDNSGGDADKYFEEIPTVSDTKYVGDTLTWDGNIDGRVYIEKTETQDNLIATMKFVKMSDSIPTEEDFKNGCSISMYINAGEESQSQTDEFTYDDMVAEGFFLGDGCIQAGHMFIIPYDNYTLTLPEDDSNTSFVFPEAGIYFVCVDIIIYKMYSTSLTIPGYNFSTATYKTAEVIKTEHLPEHLRFGKITTTTGGSDTLTWDGNTDGLVNISNAVFKVSDAVPTLDDIHRGFSYTVSDNNGNEVATVPIPVETASEITMNDIGIINYSKYVYVLTQSITDSGVTYPIGVYLYRDENNYISSLTINGYDGFVFTETKVVKIDPKYLPDDIGGGGSGSGLPEVSADDNGKSVSVVDGEWVVKKLSYNDLSDKPTLFSGSYNDLSDKPMLDTQMSDTSTNMVQNKVIKAYIDAAIGAAIAASY